MDTPIATRTTVALVLHRADGNPVATEFQRAAFGRKDPFARQREIAWEGPKGIAAGCTSFIGELEVASFPHTETLVVVEGELILAAEGANPLVLGHDAGAVIACGTSLRIQAASRVRFVWCALECERPVRAGITPLRAEADFEPSAPPPAHTLLGPAPQCRSDNVFTDEQAQYRAGTWDSTGYHRIVRPHPLNEFMHLLAGSVRFACADGSVVTARAGDALFVPQGEPVGWESSERVAKFYAVQTVQD
ncbi:DUF861 domain-containing protein [Ramlibacter henchirensis]|uniref:DUF861 domain-containing protein n=1 Tax=Ramlibacter henchirensis TaxID=204072 RepID=A0A4Z0C5L2_9BURK|nr:cupin domain-containing protein [Ramlibacter henchirensis]TFZ05638.1 DUF861 domain-containing protein [Ramlibacter henchirensis]